MKKLLCTKKTIPASIFMGLLLSTISPLIAKPQSTNSPKNEGFYIQRANLYLPSFPFINRENQPTLEELQKEKKTLTLQEQRLSGREKRELVFTMLENHSVYKDIPTTGVLDKAYLQKMEIFSGS